MTKFLLTSGVLADTPYETSIKDQRSRLRRLNNDLYEGQGHYLDLETKYEPKKYGNGMARAVLMKFDNKLSKWIQQLSLFCRFFL